MGELSNSGLIEMKTINLNSKSLMGAGWLFEKFIPQIT